MEQLLIDYDDIIKRSSDELKCSSNFMLVILMYSSLPIDNNKKLFSISKVNGKKCHMLPAEAILHKFSNVKLFALEDSVDSSFMKVVKLLSRHVFRIKCKIESVLLSSETNYACYLVFKLSDECGGLHHPVKVRDQLPGKNKEIEVIYFRSPSPINLHDTFRIPEKGKDGWMEVNVWEFKTDKELKDSHVPMDLILTSYQRTMRGLILNGIEFRPM
nr:serine/threonine-protein kinase, active site protein [Tanacetum cinerariifolium]